MKSNRVMMMAMIGAGAIGAQPAMLKALEVAAAARSITREYGNVIGENQARNIAYHALVAARGVTFEAEK